MYLTQIPRFPSFSTLKKKDTAKQFDLLTKSLDESVLRGIKSLRNDPSISLSWLSLAVDFLSSIHTEAMTLISNFKISISSLQLTSRYLDDSVKILDLCNSICSEIERLRQRRLLINFILHLLSDSENSVKVQRARNSLSDSSFSFGSKNIQHLVRDLAVALESAPRGKISPVDRVVRRMIHAVGLVTVFVAGVLVSAFHGSADIVAVRVPPEFLWADSFNGLQSTISTELNRRFGGEKKIGYLVEIDDVEARKSKLCDVIDDVDGIDREERLSNAVKELEKAMETFSKGLDGLSNGVNGMFNTVLCTRNAMMDNLREPTK